jgi:hypothetical protein
MRNFSPGPSRDTLVATPLMRAMDGGKPVRFEENPQCWCEDNKLRCNRRIET